MSSKKLKKEEKEWALSTKRFKTVSDDTPVDITKLSEDDKGLYYKDEPYTTKKLQQRLIITYCLKYALYQKSIHRNRDSFHCINEKRSLMFFMKSVVFEQIINSYYSPQQRKKTPYPSKYKGYGDFSFVNCQRRDFPWKGYCSPQFY